MQDYNFEEFKSDGPRFNAGITLGKSNRFYIGTGLSKKNGLNKMVGVKLLYDKNKNAIGFKFISVSEEGMVPINKLKDNSLYLNAKAFLGMYGISAEKHARKYMPTEIMDSNGNKIFVIELKATE
jgi:hypothetical protein